MNDKFDELTKSLAQSMTRQQALKKFGVGIAGIALAALGLPSEAQARKRCGNPCDCFYVDPHFPFGCCPNDQKCVAICNWQCQ